MRVSYDFLCLDEHDSPNLSELKYKTRKEIKTETNRRHFGLCGVIIPGADYPEINIDGRKIQEKLWGNGKYEPFHYADILTNRKKYAFLGTNLSKRKSITEKLNNFVKNIDIKLFTVLLTNIN